MKVARRISAGDFHALAEGLSPHVSVAIGLEPEGLVELAHRSGVWVSVVPMPETVKSVADDGFVVGTVEREGLSIAVLPIVAPLSLVRDARDGDDLLRRVVASGRELQRL